MTPLDTAGQTTWFHHSDFGLMKRTENVKHFEILQPLTNVIHVSQN